MAAFTQSGISDVLAEKIIERMIANLPHWKELINQSFLPEKMKKDYCSLLDKRERALNP
jgi:serine/threonine-protein kinase HipA